MAIPSIWNPPVYPDFYACNEFYSSLIKPDASDCHYALRMLLSGSDDHIWQIGRGLHGIPQIRTYGQYMLHCDLLVSHLRDNARHMRNPTAG